MQVRFRNLQVIPKHLVKLHLQRTDLRAFPLALFNLSNVLPAVVAQVAELVQLRVNTLADHIPVRQGQRRLVSQRLFNPLAKIV